MPETKEQMIERCVQAMVPELRIALDAVLSGEVCHAFTAVDGTNRSTGMKSKVVCFIAFEYYADILEGAALGISKANEKLAKQMQDGKFKAGKSA